MPARTSDAPARGTRHGTSGDRQHRRRGRANTWARRHSHPGDPRSPPVAGWRGPSHWWRGRTLLTGLAAGHRGGRPRRPRPQRLAHGDRVGGLAHPRASRSRATRHPLRHGSTNNGKSAITDAHVGVRMPWDGALGTRSALKSAATRTGYSYAAGRQRDRRAHGRGPRHPRRRHRHLHPQPSRSSALNLDGGTGSTSSASSLDGQHRLRSERACAGHPAHLPAVVRRRGHEQHQARGSASCGRSPTGRTSRRAGTPTRSAARSSWTTTSPPSSPPGGRLRAMVDLAQEPRPC